MTETVHPQLAEHDRNHATRIIRREFERVGGKFKSEDEKKTLIATAMAAAAEKNAAIEIRSQAIERVIHQWMKGMIRADGTPRLEGEEDTEETPVVESAKPEGTPIPTGAGLPPTTLRALAEHHIGTLEKLRAWKDEHGDFTQMRGVGVSSAAILDALLDESGDPEPEGENHDEGETPERPEAAGVAE